MLYTKQYKHSYIKRTKIMAFKGTEPIWSKIVIDNILEQVNTSTYLAVTFHIQKRKTYIPKSQNFYKYWDF
jgi:hypothetical protein